MSEVMGLIVALISGGALATAITVLANRRKTGAEARQTDTQTLLDELKYSREQLAEERREKAELKGQLKAVTEQALAQETDCQRKIAKLQKEVEELRETILNLSLEVGRLKSQ